MKQEEPPGYGQMKKKALEQLRSGKSLYGKDGTFAPLLKRFLDAALEAELESRLDEAERSSGNRKNGKTGKDVRTSDVTISVNTSRDRNSSFEPELIRKRETILAESLESKIIGMYGLGMSLRDISKHIKDMYDTETSHSTLSAITDKIIPEVKEWQSRPLDELYTHNWIKHDDIVNGGVLHFEMGDKPETQKGTANEDAPFSLNKY